MSYVDFSESIFERDHVSYGADKFGYGLKVSTPYKVKIDNKWHRVYCSCISNTSSCFVVINNSRALIDEIKLYNNHKYWLIGRFNYLPFIF